MPHAPRWRVALTLVQSALTVVTLVALYYLLPLTLHPDDEAATLLVGGLVGLGVLVSWQIRAVVRAPYPGLRALETLAVVAPTFLLLFATGYHLASEADPAAFTEPVSRTDALYFTITVLATVGFGDIAPVTDGTRIVVSLQMIADLVLLGFVLRALLDAVHRARRR